LCIFNYLGHHTKYIVDQINDFILSLVPSDHKEYLSSNSIDMSNTIDNIPLEAITLEFLNILKTYGIPNHNIKLKTCNPIMLLRNLDQYEDLCNGTRLTVTRLVDHVIEAKIISRKNVGNLIYIPRMSLSLSQSPRPFKLIKRQIPLIVSYAMTINKS